MFIDLLRFLTNFFCQKLNHYYQAKVTSLDCLAPPAHYSQTVFFAFDTKEKERERKIVNKQRQTMFRQRIRATLPL
jgi:serine protease inhibitor